MSPRQRSKSPHSAPSLHLRPIPLELKAALDSSRAKQFDRTYVVYIGKLQALHELVQAEARKPSPARGVLLGLLKAAGLRAIPDA